MLELTVTGYAGVDIDPIEDDELSMKIFPSGRKISQGFVKMV